MQTCVRSWDLNRAVSVRYLLFRMKRNKYSSTVIIAAITSQMHKAKLPTHVELDSRYCDIAKDSVILLEQVRTIDKQRLKEKVCHLDNTIIRRVNEALRISLEL